MRYIIYGAGGIGGGIGALLTQAGREAVLIARGDHLIAMREQGLLVRRPHSVERVAVQTAAQPSAIDFREDDIVLLTMKGQDTHAALDDLEAAAGPDIPVVCAQNGVANERAAARRFTNVYAMLIVMPATFLTPGEVALHAEPLAGLLDCGRFPRGTDDRIAEVCADLTAAGFSATPDDHAMRLKYGKLLTNLRNALQALCGVREERAGPELRAFVDRLRDEALACYAAAGIAYAPLDEINRRRAAVFTSEQVEGVERGGGSTWQSFRRGLPAIETDYLNGEIVLLGVEHHIPTPANRALQLLSRTALRESRNVGETTLEEILALERTLQPPPPPNP